MEREDKLTTYEMYNNFIQSIKHFDNMQTNYRVMASTSLLAIFAAIGFICSVENKSLPFNPLLAVMLISLIGLTAIIILWHLDLIFYERLLISNFTEAFKLEGKHDWLPRVHHNMFHDNSYQCRPAVIFYIGCSTNLLLIVGLTGSYMLNTYTFIGAIAAVAITIFSVVFFALFIRRKTGNFKQKVKDLIANPF